MVYKHYSIYRLEVKVNFEFKKEVVITIKGNETSSWLAIWQTAITHQPVLPIDTTCIWSNTIAAG